MISIQELLFNRGLNRNSKTKLVRHKSSNFDLYNLYRTDKASFLQYQSQQYKDVFKGVEFVVSFVGEEGNYSRFVGVFKVNARIEHESYLTSVDTGTYKFEYSLDEVGGFDDLKERVIIYWENPISWHQWIENEMAVIEIHPGLHYKQFTDYFDFMLTYSELKEIVTKEYSEWKRALSITKGIYLISDTKSGKLYVGAAYGELGIWGRWSEYVRTRGHGNNKSLKELMNLDPLHSDNFQFSVLMLLPKTTTPGEAHRKELLFKNKLGTNAFGLNNN